MNKNKKNISVFVDFDGTITLEDIGDKLFIDFGEFEPWHTMLKNGDINIRDYWHKLTGTLDPNLTFDEIARYALKFDIDPYFSRFADYCMSKGYNLRVVSDGFDAYISPIMNKLGLSDLPLSINRLRKNKKGFFPEFPGASESCNCLSASCKRNAMLVNSGPDDIIIFVGDGYSDYCAAEHADIVFAKKHLAAYCNKNRIPHYPWTSFFDVIRLLEDAEKKHNFRVRHQAFLKRKKAFEVE